jgi:hypothetical protein
MLRTAPPATIVDWPADDRLDGCLREPGGQSKLQDALERQAAGGIGTSELLLGAIITTYSRKADIEFTYSLERPQASHPLGGRIGSTFNGRSFSFFGTDRFEPENADGWVVLKTGGLGNFAEENVFLCPPVWWTSSLAWRPDSNNPMRWLASDGRETARFERFNGPVRDNVAEPLYRQPMMQRWVATDHGRTQLITRAGAVVGRKDLFVGTSRDHR